MATINQLSAIDTLQGGDQLPVYDQSNGDARKASLTTLLDYFKSAFTNPEFTVSISGPTSAGFTFEFANSGANQWLILQPSTALASGTLVLPLSTAVADGQEIMITSTDSINLLTVNGNGSTVNGAPGVLGADSFFRLRYNSVTGAWFRVG